MSAGGSISQNFARLSAMERVILLDRLTAAVAEVVREAGEDFHPDIIRTVVGIHRTLHMMRGDLAMIDDPRHRAIIAHAEEIVRAMQACLRRQIAAPKFH